VKSLRGRLMLGAALWTIGLLAVWVVVLNVWRGARATIIVVHQHGPVMAALAVTSMVTGLIVVRSAIVPLEAMRRRLADVRKGLVRHLEGRYPSEVQPLVDDLNALLSHNDQMVRRAIGKAGDLAHGLKTPLAILSNEAQRLQGTGDPELAAVIDQQLSVMQRQVEYHLAHARAAASGTAPGARASVLESSEGLARALQRLHESRGLSIEVDVLPEHAFRGQREDLDEMLGNLLDNACKWARSRVRIASTLHAGALAILVDDDGPGLDLSMRETVLQRGVRADEAAPGSGLGLAIVRDLAEVYGGSIALEGSPLGGLRARLALQSVGSPR
jgi:signal transduction histidine kinase